MARLTTIEIDKEDIKFSAAHFTIFSATERERLHGHNFKVFMSVVAPVHDDGLCFSYHLLKDRLRDFCNSLDEYTILPAHSPNMSVEDDGNTFVANHNGDVMRFLKTDTKVLPVRNTTVEELSHFILETLREDQQFVQENEIQHMLVKVSSGPGQCGSSEWHL